MQCRWWIWLTQEVTWNCVCFEAESFPLVETHRSKNTTQRLDVVLYNCCTRPPLPSLALYLWRTKHAVFCNAYEAHLHLLHLLLLRAVVCRPSPSPAAVTEQGLSHPAGPSVRDLRVPKQPASLPVWGLGHVVANLLALVIVLWGLEMKTFLWSKSLISNMCYQITYICYSCFCIVYLMAPISWRRGDCLSSSSSLSNI